MARTDVGTVEDLKASAVKAVGIWVGVRLGAL
jgi:hypothetical protein